MLKLDATAMMVLVLVTVTLPGAVLQQALNRFVLFMGLDPLFEWLVMTYRSNRTYL